MPALVLFLSPTGHAGCSVFRGLGFQGPHLLPISLSAFTRQAKLCPRIMGFFLLDSSYVGDLSASFTASPKLSKSPKGRLLAQAVQGLMEVH